MPSINITETQLGTANDLSPLSNAVFIVGFTSKSDAPKVPTKCETKDQFTELFGETAAAFEADQEYPRYVATTSSATGTDGFTTNAIPSDTSLKMFNNKDVDPSYNMAISLLTLGLTVVYQCVLDSSKDVVTTPAVASLYSFVKSNTFEDTVLGDVGQYNVAYLTLGGYPSFEYTYAGATAKEEDAITLADKMIACAQHRGDCVALIDATNNTQRAIGTNADTSVFKSAQSIKQNIKQDDSTILGSYGALFYPYVNNEAPSFAYLKCVANAAQNADGVSALAIAGVNRAVISGAKAEDIVPMIPNSVADAYSTKKLGEIAINGITNIVPYGPTVWGNRTLLKNKTTSSNGEYRQALSFLNVRVMVNNIKKYIRSVAQSLTFEPNNDILWVNFKAGISTYLDQLITGYGLSKYTIEKQDTKGKLATVKAKIKLYVIEAVEDWELELQVIDSTVTEVEGE